MPRLFCDFKTLLSLFFMLTVSAGAIFFARSAVCFAFIVLSLAAGISFGRLCLRSLSFRFWIFFLSFGTVHSAFLITFWESSPMMYLGCIILGLCSGGIIFILVPVLLISSSCNPAGSAMKLGFLLSSAAASGFAFAFFLAEYPAAVLFLFGIPTIVIPFFFLHPPQAFHSEGALYCSRRHRSNGIKVSAFFLLISLTAAVVIQMNYSDIFFETALTSGIQQLDAGMTVFNLGIAAGPLLSCLVAYRKGVYSSSVSLIFLAELAVMCAGIQGGDNLITGIGFFSAGALITSPVSLCPYLVRYISGPLYFDDNICRTGIMIPLGLSALLPMNMADLQLFASYPPVIFSLLMLAAGFFTIFSAWSHRLMLLKGF